jgi:hypothetical protein
MIAATSPAVLAPSIVRPKHPAEIELVGTAGVSDLTLGLLADLLLEKTVKEQAAEVSP